VNREPFLSILVVGPTERREFVEARAALGRFGRVVDVPTTRAAREILRQEGFVADLIVVAQAFPGQFSPASIDRLRAASPVSRILGLMGSWCEGEMRTGAPWPAVIRAYWHQWIPRAGRQCLQLRQGNTSGWALPVTAGEEERLLADVEVVPPTRGGLAVITTWHFMMYDWLAEACRRAGMSSVWTRPGDALCAEEVGVVLFDGTECTEDEAVEIGRLAERFAPAPVVALLDFPRVEDRDRARLAGAMAVISKPLALEDLYWHLDANRQPPVPESDAGT